MTRTAPDRQGGPLVCAECLRDLDLSRVGEIGPTPHERSDRAQAFAGSHGIDLASAYSVLLGILSLPEARAFEREAGKKKERPHYDPGFEDAVSRKLLSAQEAVARGDRVAYATRLSQKHRLPMRIAFLVTDNALSLPGALARKPEAMREARREEARRSNLSGHLAVLAVAVVAWAALTVLADRSTGAGESARTAVGGAILDQAPSVTSGLEVHRDSEGHVTLVTGENPREIFDVFVESAGPASSRAAVKLAPSEAEWVGTYREDGSVRTVTILRHPADGRWTLDVSRD